MIWGFIFLGGGGIVGIKRYDKRVGDDMFNDFKMLFIVYCVVYNNFYCNFFLEFFGLGNSSFKVCFFKENWEWFFVDSVFGGLGWWLGGWFWINIFIL